jgi:hypothetical protein
MDHIDNPSPNYRYIGEGLPQELQEEAKDCGAYVDQILNEVARRCKIPKGYLIDVDKLTEKKEISMKLKITEVKLNELTQTTIRTKCGTIANKLGYATTEVDGKVYFNTPGKYVGEFEATPAKLTEIFSEKILAGDQVVTDFAIETGILAGGNFVTE